MFNNYLDIQPHKAVVLLLYTYLQKRVAKHAFKFLVLTQFQFALNVHYCDLQFCQILVLNFEFQSHYEQIPYHPTFDKTCLQDI
jgi:hypothetical protein